MSSNDTAALLLVVKVYPVNFSGYNKLVRGALQKGVVLYENHYHYHYHHHLPHDWMQVRLFGTRRVITINRKLYLEEGRGAVQIISRVHPSKPFSGVDFTPELCPNNSLLKLPI